MEAALYRRLGHDFLFRAALSEEVMTMVFSFEATLLEEVMTSLPPLKDWLTDQS
jgi:hypothetical protein